MDEDAEQKASSKLAEMKHSRNDKDPVDSIGETL